ncbi:hypothetical protein K450DRAFT_277534 [Umbelopsis ramanniana AG]|uniref:Transcription factor domain-containing protein n=1 Tax=Umbelopsis ramanniana AG TaxID=1314678 RepID=A0AAD5EFS7_UMBRA|nr:uncharacterized protein K450DRAFT_277534 [Umbelopsis ramanniana AG]KAI8583041.1 hypothetical protein K450DRAFT_277534 [Umbelopsis ramanniana AG]
MRGTPCSLQHVQSKVEDRYTVENEESVKTFLNILKSIESLEEEISSVESQLQQRQPQNLLEQQPSSSVFNDTDTTANPNWELTIHSSNSQKLTLNINIERTADIIQLLNRLHLEFSTNVPRHFLHPQQEESLYIPFRHRRFPNLLVQYVREYSDRKTLRRMVDAELRMSSITSFHQQITPSLVQSYFNCRHTKTPLLHPEYYNQNQHNSIGHHLRLMIGCSMSLRYCIKYPFFYLPRNLQASQASYYIDRCNDLVEELMLLDHPPLTLPLLLLTLSSTYMMFQNARRSWLLIATARAYLQQHMNDFMDALMDKDGPSNPELETYKLALHLCEKLDQNISYIVENRPAQKIVNMDDMLLMPKPVLGENTLQHTILKQAFLFEIIRRRCNSRIASSIQLTNSIRTLSWSTLRQINSDFTAWYTELPPELKIGDNPFDIVKMDIPEDMDPSIAPLLMIYYSEWISVYGNTLNPEMNSDISMDEATSVESTHITFLAAMAVVKINEFLSRVEICKIEFYWLLFASEPLLHLAKSTDAYFANEARQALQKTLIILKTLLKNNLFSPVLYNLPMDGDHIAIGERLVERISNLFSSYGIEF